MQPRPSQISPIRVWKIHGSYGELVRAVLVGGKPSKNDASPSWPLRRQNPFPQAGPSPKGTLGHVDSAICCSPPSASVTTPLVWLLRRHPRRCWRCFDVAFVDRSKVCASSWCTAWALLCYQDNHITAKAAPRHLASVPELVLGSRNSNDDRLIAGERDAESPWHQPRHRRVKISTPQPQLGGSIWSCAVIPPSR